MASAKKTSDRRLNRFHVCDARQLPRLLGTSQIIDTTITSPPYWAQKDYGNPRQIGHGQSYNEYLDALTSVFTAVFDRTRPSGTLWIVSDTIKDAGNLRLLPFDIAERMKGIGWILQDIIIWYKDRTLPWSHQGKLRNIFEYIAFFSRGKRFKYYVNRVREIHDIKDYWVRYPERYCPQGKTPSRAWHFSIPRQGSWGRTHNHIKHVCPLPPQLTERIVNLVTDPGDVILDPFAGSGTVLATASAMGRHYVGIDIDKRYATLFRQRVLPSVRQSYAASTKTQENGNAVRRRFSRLILALRSIKFPKELMRIYGQPAAIRDCKAILAFPHKKNKTLVVVFVFASKRSVPRRFIETVQGLSACPPLSKYGLTPEFLVVSMRELSGRILAPRGLKSSCKLHIYQEGAFYQYSTYVSVHEFYTDSRSGRLASRKHVRYPPIYSPYEVRIDPRHPEEALEINGQIKKRKD